MFSKLDHPDEPDHGTLKKMEYLFKETQRCSFCGSGDFKVLGKRLNRAQGRNPHKKQRITTTIVRCRNCGLIFSNPMPIPKNIDDHYGKPAKEYWKQEYFVVDDHYMSGLINWMNSIQKIKAGSKILDIGAGISKGMTVFKKRGYDVFGIEPSPTFYEQAIRKMHIEKERLVQAMIEDCSFAPDTFDVILFSTVLEHVYEPARAMEKALEWLKPDGLIFIEVPSSGWLINKLIHLYYKIGGGDYVGNLSPMHPPYHLYEFSKRSFEALSERLSYEIAAHRYYVCQTFLPGVLDPFFKWIMKKTNTGMELAVWIRKKNG